MSHHAKITPEAAAKIAAQRRNTTITSFIIAILLGVLIGLTLYLIVFVPPPASIPQTRVIYAPPHEEAETPKQTQIRHSIAKPVPPAAAVSPPIISSVSFSQIAIPESTFAEPSFNYGNFDSDFGSHHNFSHNISPSSFDSIPRILKKRCSKEDRLARLQASGGKPDCEDAVVKSLRYFQKTQNPDGSWSYRYRTGLTALTLLAYLGHCETASSEEFGDTVLSAVSFLIDQGMKQNGNLASDQKDKHWPYEHAIATYALAECYTLGTRFFKENIPGLAEIVQKSGQIIVDSQHKSGGWDYHYQRDSSRRGDTSLTGWHIQAIKACKLTNLTFKGINRSARSALAYLETCQLQNGTVGYSGSTIKPGHNPDTLTAVAALSFQIFNKGSSAPARKALRHLAKGPEIDWSGPESDLYGHYYTAQALINYGGDSWSSYNTKLLPQLLENQNPDGSFKDVATRPGTQIKAIGSLFKGKDTVNTHYRTALATLTLETYYRYLPASER